MMQKLHKAGQDQSMAEWHSMKLYTTGLWAIICVQPQVSIPTGRLGYIKIQSDSQSNMLWGKGTGTGMFRLYFRWITTLTFQLDHSRCWIMCKEEKNFVMDFSIRIQKKNANENNNGCNFFARAVVLQLPWKYWLCSNHAHIYCFAFCFDRSEMWCNIQLLTT